MKGNRFVRVMKILPLVILFGALFGWIVMALWNWLMPALFGLKTITYWQGFGRLLLSKILFGGFRGGGGPGRRVRERMAERWDKMSPEEREKFKQGFSCWGRIPPESKPTT